MPRLSLNGFKKRFGRSSRTKSDCDGQKLGDIQTETVSAQSSPDIICDTRDDDDNCDNNRKEGFTNSFIKEKEGTENGDNNKREESVRTEEKQMSSSKVNKSNSGKKSEEVLEELEEKEKEMRRSISTLLQSTRTRSLGMGDKIEGRGDEEEFLSPEAQGKAPPDEKMLRESLRILLKTKVKAAKKKLEMLDSKLEANSVNSHSKGGDYAMNTFAKKEGVEVMAIPNSFSSLLPDLSEWKKECVKLLLPQEEKKELPGQQSTGSETLSFDGKQEENRLKSESMELRLVASSHSMLQDFSEMTKECVKLFLPDEEKKEVSGRHAMEERKDGDSDSRPLACGEQNSEKREKTDYLSSEPDEDDIMIDYNHSMTQIKNLEEDENAMEIPQPSISSPPESTDRDNLHSLQEDDDHKEELPVDKELSSDVAALLDDSILKNDDDDGLAAVLARLQEAEAKIALREKQLAQAGIYVEEEISYDEAKSQIEKIAKRMNEIGGSDVTCSDKKLQQQLREEYFNLEQEMDKYSSALVLTDEYKMQQEKAEQQWEKENEQDNEAALKKILRHMPVGIRTMSELELANAQSPNGKTLPKKIVQKFKRTDILTLLRVDPKDIERMHPSILESLRVTGLTLTERRALHCHLKVLGPKWEKNMSKNKSNKMTDRKLEWYNMIKNGFKESLDQYLRHVEKYGPPENHPYATRDNPNEGCPMIGRQCPIKADKIMDYSDDYGWPDAPVYGQYCS